MFNSKEEIIECLFKAMPKSKLVNSIDCSQESEVSFKWQGEKYTITFQGLVFTYKENEIYYNQACEFLRALIELSEKTKKYGYNLILPA